MIAEPPSISSASTLPHQHLLASAEQPTSLATSARAEQPISLKRMAAALQVILATRRAARNDEHAYWYTVARGL